MQTIKYLSEECVELLKLAQDGDRMAQDDLILLIKDKFMGKRIGRYLHRNRQVEDEDLKQEFMIGVALGISEARLDMGDPIEYLISQGVFRVRSYLRRNIITNTMQTCNNCGNITRLNRVGRDYVCKKCGSNDVLTQEVSEYNDVAIESAVDKNRFEEHVESDIILDQFEKTLNPATNIYSLYVLLKDGMNRDNPDVKNYIKAIAKEWGGCSEQNVVQNMEKLRKKINQFAMENDLVIENHHFISIK